MIQELVQHLYPYNEINQSLKVNLEKNFPRFSFINHYPEKQLEIDQIFKMTVPGANGKSVSSLLQASAFDKEDLILLEKLGFTQLSPHPEFGIILEHPTFPGWLIKKNYGFKEEGGFSKRILKVVKGTDFPFWMLPSHLQKLSQNEFITIQVPNDVIHPLRVIMLRRGRKWIKHFKFTHIKAAKEYLYLIPGIHPKKPLYKCVVVLSRKENILNLSDNLWHYTNLANVYPNKLKQIANQIVYFIRYVRLSDSHLNNFPFLNDGTDTVIAIDGEPVGGLADTHYPEMVKAVEAFDPCFYSLLGLKQLQTSIYEQMQLEDIEVEDIKKVQNIFNEVINSAITSIIRERAWQLAQLKAYESPILMNVAFLIFRSLYTLYYSQQFLSFKDK